MLQLSSRFFRKNADEIIIPSVIALTITNNNTTQIQTQTPTQTQTQTRDIDVLQTSHILHYPSEAYIHEIAP